MKDIDERARVMS